MGKKTDSKTVLERQRAEFMALYDAELEDATGQLYNRFVAYISEARIPLNNVLMVLEILKAEAVEQMRKKQGLI